jgi:hypothetical protein
MWPFACLMNVEKMNALLLDKKSLPSKGNGIADISVIRIYDFSTFLEQIASELVYSIGLD